MYFGPFEEQEKEILFGESQNGESFTVRTQSPGPLDSTGLSLTRHSGFSRDGIIRRSRGLQTFRRTKGPVPDPGTPRSKKLPPSLYSAPLRPPVPSRFPFPVGGPDHSKCTSPRKGEGGTGLTCRGSAPSGFRFLNTEVKGGLLYSAYSCPYTRHKKGLHQIHESCDGACLTIRYA